MATVWIDSLEFNDYGGFTKETQFIQEMGSGYLLALQRPGVPVAPAVTTFVAESAGQHRVWVRTKNWYPSHSPGKLKVLVNGNYLPTELSTKPSNHWYWEVAGDVELAAGTHTLSVEDTTGYFSRFAAVIVTTNMNFTPDQRVEGMQRQRALLRGISLTPQDMGQWDLVVVGAGPGGIPAAIAAARKGLRVALVHSRPGLGGNASDEGTVGLDGAGREHFGMRESGIAEEIRRKRDFLGLSWEGALRLLVEAEPNITVFYNQFAVSTSVQNNSIEHIVAMHGVDGTYHQYSAPFFVDSTGDGWVGYYAGADYRIGSEARWEYNERFAPETANSHTMSGCLMGSTEGKQILGYYAEDAGKPVPFTAPEWAVKLPEGDNLHREPARLHTGEWWLENPTDWDDLWEQETVRDELLRLNLGYFHWIKNSYSRRGLAKNLEITAFGRYNARRENRRLMGDYVLTQTDCETGARFADAVSYCGWTLDVHHPRGIYSGNEGPYYSDALVQITDIPLRCLYSKNINNLLLSGRCVSVSHLALGSVRVEGTLATIGQAVGTTAALCIKHKVTPRGIYEQHMVELQQTLLRDDLYLPDQPNQDENDHARHATITASSTNEGLPVRTTRGVARGWQALCGPRIMSLPYQESMAMVAPYIKNENSTTTWLTATLCQMPYSGDYENMERLATIQIEIPPQHEGYVSLPLQPTKPTTPNKAIGLLLEPAAGISWREMDFCSDGRRRGEPIDKHYWATNNSNSYDVCFAEKVKEIANCSPENVCSGTNRLLHKDDYGWVSLPEQQDPPWLALHWNENISISSFQLTFDTDLANPSYSYLEYPAPGEMVKSYTVFYQSKSGWVELASQQENHMRVARHTFPSITTKKLKIQINETWGDPCARLLEVRVY